MANYFLSNKALEDLTSIWDYTYETWSERQANKYYEMLVEGFNELANEPKVGKNYSEISKHIFGYHLGKHILFYRLQKSDGIEIIRILHESMDLRERIGEE